MHPAMLSFITERKMKTFHDQQNLNQSVATKPVLWRILNGILHTQEDKCNHKNTEKNKTHQKRVKKVNIIDTFSIQEGIYNI
jgi:hypothetical protein